MKTYRWQNSFQYFLIALQLLTILPVKLKEKPRALDEVNSTVFFPLVGFIIGILLFVMYLILRNYFSFWVTSAFILTGWIYLTGALHIDGLADTIDGLSGGKDKKEILAIMKDVRTGAKGTAAIVVLVLLKFSLLTQVVTSSTPQILMYIPLLSRWGILIGCFSVPYAREEGMGKSFSFPGYPQIIIATLIVILSGIFLLGAFFLAPLIGVAGFSLLFSLYLKRKIGGFTGDTLGALNEMGEVIALLISCFA
ncbi:adenosylcobinamide-GDP ribazoletransferase [Candidatus Aerophobetes bacterium]|nr:adenosylcobinamide-GDP ribazoletransferase [Candidatus Aerophobetes bacterium]